jgi:hypothetical protein
VFTHTIKSDFFDEIFATLNSLTIGIRFIDDDTLSDDRARDNSPHCASSASLQSYFSSSPLLAGSTFSCDPQHDGRWRSCGIAIVAEIGIAATAELPELPEEHRDAGPCGDSASSVNAILSNA